ncbi:MAG TPA: hypothetical protein DDW45_07850 [Gammaproteobacteria bacterium]|nr:hypothetical protein [Gammaproteobacteria bacterium]
MSVILFRLRGVPDDEIDEIRELLRINKIDFYETSAGNWGISMPAIWLRDNSRLEQAKQLLELYQDERATRMKGEYARLKERGENRTLLDIFKEDPLRMLLYVAAVAAILYFSVMPFLDFGGV